MAYPVRIQYPGNFIDLPDDNAADEICVLIRIMEDQLIDAALVLDFYNKETKRIITVIRKKLKAGDKRLDRHHRLTRVYANYFVYALAIFGNCFKAIAGDDYNLSANIKTLKDDFEQKLPALRNVRNSLMHIEDRARGLGRPEGERKKTKMQLKDNFLVLGCLLLNVNKLECTAADGSRQQIGISRKTLDIAEVTLQSLIDSLPWRGFPHGYLTDKVCQQFRRKISKSIK